MYFLTSLESAVYFMRDFEENMRQGIQRTNTYHIYLSVEFAHLSSYYHYPRCLTHQNARRHMPLSNTARSFLPIANTNSNAIANANANRGGLGLRSANGLTYLCVPFRFSRLSVCLSFVFVSGAGAGFAHSHSHVCLCRLHHSQDTQTTLPRPWMRLRQSHSARVCCWVRPTQAVRLAVVAMAVAAAVVVCSSLRARQSK